MQILNEYDHTTIEMVKIKIGKPPNTSESMVQLDHLCIDDGNGNVKWQK
jgi:hypothetical protein